MGNAPVKNPGRGKPDEAPDRGDILGRTVNDIVYSRIIPGSCLLLLITIGIISENIYASEFGIDGFASSSIEDGLSLFYKNFGYVSLTLILAPVFGLIIYLFYHFYYYFKTLFFYILYYFFMAPAALAASLFAAFKYAQAVYENSFMYGGPYKNATRNWTLVKTSFDAQYRRIRPKMNFGTAGRRARKRFSEIFPAFLLTGTVAVLLLAFAVSGLNARWQKSCIDVSEENWRCSIAKDIFRYVLPHIDSVFVVFSDNSNIEKLYFRDINNNTYINNIFKDVIINKENFKVSIGLIFIGVYGNKTAFYLKDQKQSIMILNDFVLYISTDKIFKNQSSTQANAPACPTGEKCDRLADAVEHVAAALGNPVAQAGEKSTNIASRLGDIHHALAAFPPVIWDDSPAPVILPPVKVTVDFPGKLDQGHSSYSLFSPSLHLQSGGGGIDPPGVPEEWRGIPAHIAKLCAAGEKQKTLTGRIGFGDSRTVPDNGKWRDTLQNIAAEAGEAIAADPDRRWVILVEGAADSRGTAMINLEYAEKRAAFIDRELEKEIGDTPSRYPGFKSGYDRNWEIVSYGVGEQYGFDAAEKNKDDASPRIVRVRMCKRNSTPGEVVANRS